MVIKCDNCRVGGRDNFSHCFTCGLCLPLDKPHKCIQDTSHNNCPVCMEVSQGNTNVKFVL